MVTDMREAQRSFFSSKSSGMLALSKRIEVRVDRLLGVIDIDLECQGFEVLPGVVSDVDSAVKDARSPVSGE